MSDIKNEKKEVFGRGKRLSSLATQPMNENTPVKPANRFRIAHNFSTPDGYIRRGKAGDQRLSVAMFVKNEGETIYDALHSVAGVATEYVIGVDDSTDDNTREEIKRFMDKYDKLKFNVYEFKWENDFSKARNMAVEKCTMPWILILDGHDIFDTDGTVTLIDAMGVLSDEVHIAEFYIHMAPDEDGIPSTFFPQPRLIRNIPSNRYESAVHNYIRCDIIHKVILLDLVIQHKRSHKKSTERSKQRSKMGIEFFKKKIEEEPENTRALFYLGNMHLEDLRDYEKAAEYFERYLAVENNSFFDERSQAYINLCAAYGRIKDKFDKVRETAAKAIAEGIQRRELWIILGDYYEQIGRHKDATTYYGVATNLTMPLCQLFLSGPVYTYVPWEKLAGCYIQLENFEKAKECFLRMLQYKPRHPKIISNLRMVERKMNIKEKVKEQGINITVFDTFRSFSDDICSKLGSKNNVRLSRDFQPGVAAMSDLIFVEWGNHNAILATETNYNAPIVLRVHRYELWLPGFKHIDFSKVHALIFTSEYVKKMALQMHNEALQPLEDEGRIHIIPSSVEVDHWTFLDETEDNNVLLLGGVRYIKNYQLALDLAHINPDINFHHIGNFDAGDCGPFFEHKIEKLNNFTMYGAVQRTELNKLVGEIKPQFVLNTSMIEGCPYGILEMMSKGIVPILYDYPGASEALQLPNDHVYEHTQDFRKVFDNLKNRFYSSSELSRQNRKELRLHVRKCFGNPVILPKIYNLCMAVYDQWYVDKSNIKIKNPLNKSLEDTGSFDEVKPDENKSIPI